MANSKKILAALSFLIVFGIFVPQVHAQQSPAINVTLSPVFFDFSASPSSTIKDTIRVHNNSTAPLTFNLVVKKIITDNTGNLSLQDLKADDDIASWVKFSSKQITATPDDWTDVPFTIDVPANAAFGYYFGIDFTPNNDQSVQNGASLSGQPLVPILLTVKAPGLKFEGQVVSFKTENLINEVLPVNFITQFQNTGNIHIKPHGNIFIQSRDQKDLAVLDVNSTLGNVLPGATRTFTSDWSDGFMVNEPELDSSGQPMLDKNGKPITHFTIHWDKLTRFRIGPYTANLVLVFNNGDKDQVLESSTTFWVIPYKIIGGIIILLLVIFFGIRYMLRSYIRSQLKKSRRG